MGWGDSDTAGIGGGVGTASWGSDTPQPLVFSARPPDSLQLGVGTPQAGYAKSYTFRQVTIGNWELNVNAGPIRVREHVGSITFDPELPIRW